ncbi:amidase [Mumia sp. ZJ1417]|uniref:amidase n=1 Tax=Mumia sp. ZJ1417 TaxID=2708082 RepID=UPI00141DDCB7|nr:amidase [Mumia sp. ZJ1417]QMW65541.1 amidase [Mumia sp. ZJ1417]
MNPSARDDDLLALDLVAAAGALATGEVRAVDLAHAYLRRIAETEPDLNAYVTVDRGAALAQARAADAEIAARGPRGPLHGIPVGVKDLFDIAGLRTAYGSARFADHVPRGDAAAVTALRTAGAVVLGKQATHEFAWGGRTDSPHFGPTRNPWAHDRIPGGSSGGGGASVTARSSLLALGSDTAGSVRIPAALSGCVGLKPTAGWMSLDGAYPLAPSLDHVGLLGRTAADVGLAFHALGGRTVAGDDLSGLRVGWLVDAQPSTSAEVAQVAAASRTVAAGFAEVVDVAVPDVAARTEAILTLVRHEAEQVHRTAFADAPASYGPDLAALLELGPVADADLARAREVVTRTRAWCEAALRDVDVFVGPTVPVVAPRIGAQEIDVAGRAWPVELVLTRFTSLANATGAPAASVPVGTVDRLPVGLQVIGRAGAEAVVLAVADRLGVPAAPWQPA